MRKLIGLCLLAAVSGCGAGGADKDAATAAASGSDDAKVATSGKDEVELANLPPEVLAAATAAQAGFTPREAEAETREGRRYFDVEGVMPDGSEIEFDIMEEGGRWNVVEIQRDIAFAAAPAEVRQASAQKDPSLVPTRVIESRQADSNLTIYELYGPQGDDPQARKLEVKWDGSTAQVLDREWAH